MPMLPALESRSTPFSHSRNRLTVAPRCLALSRPSNRKSAPTACPSRYRCRICSCVVDSQNTAMRACPAACREAITRAMSRITWLGSLAALSKSFRPISVVSTKAAAPWMPTTIAGLLASIVALQAPPGATPRKPRRRSSTGARRRSFDALSPDAKFVSKRFDAARRGNAVSELNPRVLGKVSREMAKARLRQLRRQKQPATPAKATAATRAPAPPRGFSDKELRARPRAAAAARCHHELRQYHRLRRASSFCVPDGRIPISLQ